MKNPLLQNKKAISDSLAVEQSKAIETYGISTEIKLFSDRFDEIAPKPNRAEIKLVNLADIKPLLPWRLVRIPEKLQLRLNGLL